MSTEHRCTACGKAVGEVKFEKTSSGNWRGKCGPCRNAERVPRPEYRAAQWAKYKQRNPDWASEKRAWNEANRDKRLASSRKWRAENPERAREIAQVWRAANRDRTRQSNSVGKAVSRAIKAGILVRATACEQCGGGGPIEAAHADYDQPLVVRWLCRRCHRRWDQEEPKTLPKKEETHE